MRTRAEIEAERTALAALKREAEQAARTSMPSVVPVAHPPTAPTAPSVPAPAAEASPPAQNIIREKELRRAFDLGSEFWRLADSESYSDNKKSDVPILRLNDLIANGLSTAP